MTDPPMYNIADDVTCRSLAIVRSLPLPGCDSDQTCFDVLIHKHLLGPFPFYIDVEDLFSVDFI